MKSLSILFYMFIIQLCYVNEIEARRKFGKLGVYEDQILSCKTGHYLNNLLFLLIRMQLKSWSLKERKYITVQLQTWTPSTNLSSFCTFR